ncbi:hypothetical protein Tco_1172947 [Tanacetum coccineum]
MKVEESLNVTFDESPSSTKLSPLVDDDVGKEEAIKRKAKIDNNSVEKESIEVDEVVNINESNNHPFEQVIRNLNQRTLRSQDQKRLKADNLLSSSIHLESFKSATKSLFDVGSSRISIFTVNT